MASRVYDCQPGLIEFEEFKTIALYMNDKADFEKMKSIKPGEGPWTTRVFFTIKGKMYLNVNDLKKALKLLGISPLI